MQQHFGARMRQRREQQGIALASIAEQTKIKQSLLESLERDDVSSWPSGLFRRAYIRAYAQAIGLNPDIVVREFLEVHPEPVEEFETALATALATGVRGNAAPPTRLRNIVGSALGSLSRLRRAPVAPIEAEPLRHEPEPEELGRVEFEVPAMHPPEAAFVVADANDDPLEEQAAAAIGVAAPMPSVETVVDAATPAAEPVVAASRIDLSRLADVCLRIGQLQDACDVQPALNEVVGLVGASGLIVWIWDDAAEGLRPALASGYSPRVLAQLPTVGRHADNATAAAFRTATTCVMRGGQYSNAALATPLMTGSGCIGVLALELADGAEREEGVRSAASIVGAMLALWIWQFGFAEENPAQDEEAPRRRRTS
jgi:transcriptional regulator with XRE-family HTH domain